MHLSILPSNPFILSLSLYPSIHESINPSTKPLLVQFHVNIQGDVSERGVGLRDPARLRLRGYGSVLQVFRQGERQSRQVNWRKDKDKAERKNKYDGVRMTKLDMRTMTYTAPFFNSFVMECGKADR